jgi:hypothetical protein
MKYLEHTFETYVYSHCNMCNIRIYFCNTDTKHLQHAFSAQHLLDAWEWRLVDRRVEFTGVELACGAELAAPVEKAMAGRFGGEGRPRDGRETRLRERKAGDRSGQGAPWRGRKTGSRAGARWRCHREERRGVMADRGYGAVVESLVERTSGRGF